jgi:LysM repeat protein
LEVVMSVLRSEELPETPEPSSASSQDSAQIRAAARWTAPDQAAPAATVPGQAAPAATVPGQAARPEPVPAPAGGEAAWPQATRSQAARTHPLHPHPARDQVATLPLRLTRRGRVVVAVATVLLLAALSLVIAASAQATNHPVPSRATQQSLAQVTVRPGQSLWSVAENADPDADTRAVIQQIIELNGLTGNVVFAGQRLWIPRA